MDKRLSKIAAMIPHGIGLADVGTDHGYLPVHLAQRGYRGKIFASDINEAPLNCAIACAAQAHVEDKINFILCDGLDIKLKDSVDTIIIGGMGGDTICGILDRAEWCMDERYTFIFQPMTKAEVLRYWLNYNGFSVSQECLISENGFTYQILKAHFGGYMDLDEGEFFTGKYELIKDDELYPSQLERLIKRFEKAINGLNKCEDTPDEGKIKVFEKVLFCLKSQYKCYEEKKK